MGPTSPLGEPRPSLVSHTSETYEKAQEDEREVLKAVFMDDYEESEAKGAWSVSTETSPLKSPLRLCAHTAWRPATTYPLGCVQVLHSDSAEPEYSSLELR